MNILDSYEIPNDVIKRIMTNGNCSHAIALHGICVALDGIVATPKRPKSGKCRKRLKDFNSIIQVQWYPGSKFRDDSCKVLVCSRGSATATWMEILKEGDVVKVTAANRNEINREALDEVAERDLLQNRNRKRRTR